MIVVSKEKRKGLIRPLDSVKKSVNYSPWGEQENIEQEAIRKLNNRGLYARSHLPEPRDKEKEKIWRISVTEDSPWTKFDCFGMTFEKDTFFPRTELGVNPKPSVILYVLTDSQMKALKARLKDRSLKYEDNQANETRIYQLSELLDIQELQVSPNQLESNIVSFEFLLQSKNRQSKEINFDEEIQIEENEELLMSPILNNKKKDSKK